MSHTFWPAVTAIEPALPAWRPPMSSQPAEVNVGDCRVTDLRAGYPLFLAYTAASMVGEPEIPAAW